MEDSSLKMHLRKQLIKRRIESVCVLGLLIGDVTSYHEDINALLKK